MKNEQKNDVFTKDVYYSYLSNSIDFSINPLVVGFEKCRPIKQEIVSNKTCYIIHYVLSGEGILTFKNKTYNITKNNLFILPPHSNASYKQNRNNPWSYIWIELNGISMKSFLDKIQFDTDNFMYHDNDKLYLKNCLINMILDDDKATLKSEYYVILGYIFKIFSFLIKYYPKEVENYSSKQEIVVHKICEYLERKFDDPNLSLDEIAKKFYFTQSYLTRLFKKEMGITPIQYIDELRMKKAIELLGHKTFTIEQIAETLGYSNQFYFTKRFKKYYGMPPSKYKQKNLVDL